jgi:hypothetical protein
LAACAALLLLAAIALMRHRRVLSVEDDFESDRLSKAWETSRLQPASVQLQSTVVRQGRRALRLTVRHGDTFEAGRNGNADSERDELLEARRFVSRQGTLYESSWSMYLSPDFPIVPVRLVVAQWKQFCDGEGKPCDDDSPVLALRYIGGVLQVTQDIDHTRRVLWAQQRDLRGRWIDLRFQTRFTPEVSGEVRTWLDGAQVVDYRGVTANQENAASGYKHPGSFYFKMGLYRNTMQQPMTMYLDAYRKTELKAEPDR